MAVPRAVRTTILWGHLLMGTIAGLVILIMSLTGVLLAYEHQIVDFTNGYRVAAPAPGAPRASLDVLLANVRVAKPDAQVGMVTLSTDPTAPTSVRLGRAGTLYADPYTGKVLGGDSKRVHGFFELVEGVHRWLGMTGPYNRAIGRAMTGVANFVFLLIVVSGLYLWWPRRWNVQALKRVALLDWRLSGKARDFNWHNSIGVWAMVPLFFIVLSSVFMSYQWPARWLNRMSGVETPVRGGESRDQGEQRGARRGEREQRAERQPGAPGEQGRRSVRGAVGAQSERGPGGGGTPMTLPAGQLDMLWARAQAHVPGWQSATLRLPNEGDRAMTFTMNRGSSYRPDLRTRIDLNIKTGEVKPVTKSDNGLGARARAWARYVHTGEVLGLFGQTIAMLASAGAVFLVWTGITLTIRRYAAWRVRRARAKAALGVPSSVILG